MVTFVTLAHQLFPIMPKSVSTHYLYFILNIFFSFSLHTFPNQPTVTQTTCDLRHREQPKSTIISSDLLSLAPKCELLVALAANSSPVSNHVDEATQSQPASQATHAESTKKSRQNQPKLG